MSKHNPVAKAINYMFEEEGRWEAFTRFLDDGRICLTNNAAERALRGIALGRKAWLFAGSPRGGDRAGDLPPGRPSFITRVLGFDRRQFQVWQARRARCPQIAQAPGALLPGSCCRAMSAA